MPQGKIPNNCLQCGSPLKKEATDFISEKDNNFAYHITCENCLSSMILNINVEREGILSIGTITDAGKSDLEKLTKGKPLSANDVIEAYLHLNSKSLKR